MLNSKKNEFIEEATPDIEEIRGRMIENIISLPEEKVSLVLCFMENLQKGSNPEQCVTNCMEGLCGEDCPSFNYEECVPPDEKEFEDHPCKGIKKGII